MSTTEKDKLCCTVAELAKKLSVGTTTAYKLIKDKSFYPARRCYVKYIINLELLDKWLKE